MTTQAEQRRRKIQIMEIDIRADWLQDHIKRLSPQARNNPRMERLLKEWRRELYQKRMLKLDLSSGQVVNQAAIDRYTPAAVILSGGQRGRRERRLYDSRT